MVPCPCHFPLSHREARKSFCLFRIKANFIALLLTGEAAVEEPQEAKMTKSMAEMARAKYGDNASPLKEYDPAQDGGHHDPSKLPTNTLDIYYMFLNTIYKK